MHLLRFPLIRSRAAIVARWQQLAESTSDPWLERYFHRRVASRRLRRPAIGLAVIACVLVGLIVALQSRLPPPELADFDTSASQSDTAVAAERFPAVPLAGMQAESVPEPFLSPATAPAQPVDSPEASSPVAKPSELSSDAVCPEFSTLDFLFEDVGDAAVRSLVASGELRIVVLRAVDNQIIRSFATGGHGRLVPLNLEQYLAQLDAEPHCWVKVAEDTTFHRVAAGMLAGCGLKIQREDGVYLTFGNRLTAQVHSATAAECRRRKIEPSSIRAATVTLKFAGSALAPQIVHVE